MNFEICGIKHSQSKQQIVFNNICSQFCKKGVADSLKLQRRLLNCENIDELIRVSGAEAGTYVDEAVDIAVDILHNFGFTGYTSSQFNYEFGEEFDFQELHEKYFLNDYGDIIYSENAVKYMRQKERDSREEKTFWGGGFGLKGMIKGAISAEILNVASEALHAIGDSDAV